MNKYILFLYSFIIFSTCFAEKSVELTYGALTYHNTSFDKRKLNNKISEDGSWINNSIYALGLKNTYNDRYTTMRLLTGQNSVGDEIVGGTVSYGYVYKRFDVGLIAGFYTQDDVEFVRRDLKPFSIGNGYVPLVGAEAKLKLYQNEKITLLLAEIITPAILSTVLNIEFKL